MSIIAFIPVRGGSKSIPLKNIKLFNNKPLVMWVVDSLEAVDCIDEIIVATDSEEIIETVSAYKTKKTSIYHRSQENAMDLSSTESVMLEYIDSIPHHSDDVLMLVQATSPLTRPEHFIGAITLFYNGNFDSILSCTKCKRFFWNEDGVSINYDYRSRPRRQEFNGQYMENGALYLSKIGNIIKYKNRISGKIGIYEMPEYTSYEIDEPDDWIILEDLARMHKLPIKNDIKLVISDVDGVLTDSGMYYSENGDELKKFNTRDGMGFEILRKMGVKTAIITSEKTELVKRRALKLKVDHLIQGKRNGGKLAAALEICNKEGISLLETAYIGDDLNCYELLQEVGIAACPADAVMKIKKIPGIHVLGVGGGKGAFRELVNWIVDE